MNANKGDPAAATDGFKFAAGPGDLVNIEVRIADSNVPLAGDVVGGAELGY
jgi:hypothetical protein